MKKLFYILFLGVIVLGCETKSESSLEKYKLETVTLSSGELYRIDSFPSKFITPRPVDVWLPNGYTKDENYAVLYMHDGQMLFDAHTTWNKQEWKVDEWASKLMNEGKTRDFIVVAPHNISEIRYNDYFPNKPFQALSEENQQRMIDGLKQRGGDLTKIYSDGYLQFLVKELKPYIDKEYSVKTDKENTVVMGSSMGGLISMYAICEYPDIFGAAAGLSTHWVGAYPMENNPMPQGFFTYMEANLPNADTHKVYFDFGTKTLDSLYVEYEDEVTGIITKKGYTYNLKFEGADHSENSWNQRLDVPLTYILSKD